MAASVGVRVNSNADSARLPGSLTRRSNAEGLAQLAGHVAALVATGLLVNISMGSAWLAPALVVYGFVLVFLFSPLHECIHRTAFRSGWINTAVAWLCGAVLMLPPKYFRAFHFTHHRFTQDPQRDPELRFAKPSTWRSYLWTVSGIPYWRERMTTLVQHAMGRVHSAFISDAARPGIVREARILLGIYGLIAVVAVVNESAAVLYYWVIPALLGQPFLRMYLLAEHTGCPLVGDMLLNTRTTLTNRVMRRLAWNMPFHTAHHANPGVPFHALAAEHARIREWVRHEARGYWRVQRELARRFGEEL